MPVFLRGLFLIGALICFLLGAARVPASISWTDAGLALATIAVLGGIL